MPKKPTQPYGYLTFSRSGKVSKEMFELSNVKETQEAEVGRSFVAAFNSSGGERQITGVSPMEQADHDFSARVNGAELHVQITELVDRSYTFPMSDEEYNAGRFGEAVQKAAGERPWRIDAALRDEALWRVIEKKLQKNYARPQQGELWLLVFTTAPLYLTEYVEAGVPRNSRALEYARERLQEVRLGPFSEVWFTDLKTRPVKICGSTSAA